MANKPSDHGWMDGWKEGVKEGRKEGREGGWMDGWMAGEQESNNVVRGPNVGIVGRSGDQH